MTIRVARLTRYADWSALDADQVVGTAHGLMHPDGRWFVSIDTWRSEVFDELLDVVAADLRQPLHVIVDERAGDEVARWLSAGFHIARREYEFEIPTDPAVTGLGEEPLPDGIILVAADEVDEAGLRNLDDLLRQDVPGGAGWRNDPGEFREYTFNELSFDPAVYLVALDADRHHFAGLVRVWINRRRARLGLVGVIRERRRTGLARAMLATVFRRLHERGVHTVLAEADDSNEASNALLAGVGATRVGSTLELFRAASWDGGG